MKRQLFIFLFLITGFVSSALAEEEYWEYTFRPGDSVWNIAKEYTNSVHNWSEIQRINSIRQGADKRIRPGTRIVIPVSMLKLQPTPALVIAVDGEPKLKRKNGNESIIVVGNKLYIGDRVYTAEKQSVRLQFADKSELQVLSHSEIKLDKLSYYKETGMVDTRIRLNSGSVNTWVEKQNKDSVYEIITPAAITAVRGTAFRLSADEGNISRTEVTEGVVAVMAGDSEKSVKDGYGIVAEKDKPLPEPVKLLPAPEITLTSSDDFSELSASWTALDGAAYYRYQLAKDEDFNQVLRDEKVQTTQADLSGYDAGTYYLKVRGVDALQLEGLDATVSVEQKAIIPPPPPPPVEEESHSFLIIIGTVLLMMLL